MSTIKLALGLSLPTSAVTETFAILARKDGEIIKLTPRLSLPVSGVSDALLRRFWSKVDKSGPTVRAELGPCWIRTGYKRNGYSSISIDGIEVYSHKLAHELFVGPVPDGQDVCHKCDICICVRPDHLFAGTRAENLSDMREKGRDSKPPIFRGEQHAMVTLTDVQVAELRAARGTQRELAKQFNVSQSTVWRLRHNITRSGGR